MSEQKRSERRYPRAPALLSRNQQIEEALALRAPSPREREACRHDVEGALNVLEGVNRAIEHAKVKKKSMRRYSAILWRMQAVSKAHTAAGGSLALRQYHIDRAVLCDKAFCAVWHPPSPWLKHKESVRLAHGLLTTWGRRIVTTAGGEWARLAAILYGDKRINLFRHLRAFAAEIRSRKK